MWHITNLREENKMLKHNLVLNFTLRLKSGLHIGGGDDTFDIGGADSLVVKNPLNNQPYIPGSSLKGKLRALLTQKYGKIVKDNKDPDFPYSLDLDNLQIKSLFAPTGDEEAKLGKLQITRGIYRDCMLTDESAADLQRYLGAGTFTEVKAENSISPLRGKAANPRFIERVPAGACFDGQIVLQIFDGDDEEELKKLILEACRMLESSYLGGSGTRGYGQVEFITPLEFEEVSFE